MSTDFDVLIDESILTELANKYSLILWNDDYNTFDHVIECLRIICKHEEKQAEQCAMIVHSKGKCQIKSGELQELQDMKDHLIDQGLSVTIQKN